MRTGTNTPSGTAKEIIRQLVCEYTCVVTLLSCFFLNSTRMSIILSHNTLQKMVTFAYCRIYKF